MDACAVGRRRLVAVAGQGGAQGKKGKERERGKKEGKTVGFQCEGKRCVVLNEVRMGSFLALTH